MLSGLAVSSTSMWKTAPWEEYNLEQHYNKKDISNIKHTTFWEVLGVPSRKSEIASEAMMLLLCSEHENV